MRVSLTTILVRDYDEAISYYCDKLGFELQEDTALSAGKRWVVVALPNGGAFLLAKAASEEQKSQIGQAAGGRVAHFLEVENFDAVYSDWKNKHVNFLEEPRTEAYGKVVQFADLYGNKWDLITASWQND